MKHPTYGQRIPKPMNKGYLRVWNPEHQLSNKDGLILVHRQIYYDKFGAIPKGFHIHHKDGNKLNNTISNLVLLANYYHQKEHAIVGKVVKNQYGTFFVKPEKDRVTTKKANKAIYRECKHCSTKFNMKRSDARYCSRSCQIRHWKQMRAAGLI